VIELLPQLGQMYPCSMAAMWRSWMLSVGTIEVTTYHSQNASTQSKITKTSMVTSTSCEVSCTLQAIRVITSTSRTSTGGRI
jgi:hypothetical protein